MLKTELINVLTKAEQAEFAKIAKPFEHRDYLGAVRGLRSHDGNILILSAAVQAERIKEPE